MIQTKPTQILSPEKIAQLTNQELYKLCRSCGTNIRTFLKEFAAYLPEVEKRRLYKQHGCNTLYEFAAKLACMTTETVDDILKVNKKLDEKPVLQALIGKEGWSKVKVVATIATPETEKFWAEKVQTMSKETLKTFVKELKKEKHEILANGQNELFSTTETPPIPWLELRRDAIIQQMGPEPSTPLEASQKTAFTIRLDDETEVKLRIFKQRLEKQTGEPQDWNQTIKEMLKMVEEHGTCSSKKSGSKKLGLTKKSEQLATTEETVQSPSISQLQTPTVAPAKKETPSAQPILSKEDIKKSLPSVDQRYIPARVKHYLEQKYKGKCGFPGCKNPFEIYHHTRRFSLEPNHDPEYIVPLCKRHERLVHHGLIENEELSPENWKMRLVSNKISPKHEIDQQVQRYTRETA